MASKQSPFYSVDYGWSLGEGGWNTGMDDNLVKLGFFARRVVDTFESTLPSTPAAGRSCILPDNTVNVYVEKWYSVAPTIGEVYKVGGVQYEFTGSSFILRQSAEDVEATLTPQIDSIQSELQKDKGILNLGTVTTNTTISIADSNYIKVAVGADLDFTFSDLPPSGEVSRWTLELEVLGEYVIGWPSTVWDGGVLPNLGNSGIKIINFTNSGGTRFGQVEVGNVLVESSQGVFLGGSVVVPSTNPSTSAGGTTPSDVITTENGQVFLKEGKVAAITDDANIAKIRQYAPWLEVGVYEKTYSNITFLSADNVITASLLDFLWDDVSLQWICLTQDISGTGSTLNRARILTSPDMVTFTLTTGLNTNNLTDGTWTTLLKFIDGDGVVKFMLTKYFSESSLSGSTISGFVSTSFSATSWPSRTVLNSSGGGTVVSLLGNNASRSGAHWLAIRAGVIVERFNASGVLETFISAASTVASVDYDGVSKYYYSTSGAILDQTNSNIGISFVGATDSGAANAAIAPWVKYIPELAGWIALEMQMVGATVTSTTVPRVFFRPDATQIWGQISTFPTSVKFYWSASNTVSLTRASEVLYYNNTIIVTGLVDTSTDGTPKPFWTHAATSTDGGVTWDVVKVSDVLLPTVGRTPSTLQRFSSKRNKSGEYFKIVSPTNNISTSEYVLSVASGDAFVETNQSAASPTVTSVYTRIV